MLAHRCSHRIGHSIGGTGAAADPASTVTGLASYHVGLASYS